MGEGRQRLHAMVCKDLEPHVWNVGLAFEPWQGICPLSHVD